MQESSLQTESGRRWERSRMQRLGFLYAGERHIPGQNEPLDSARLGKLLFCIRHEGYGHDISKRSASE